MPHRSLLRLQMLLKAICEMFGDQWSRLRDRITFRGTIRILLLKILWGVTAVLCSGEVTRNLQQAAKRPLDFSDVAVGLCRPLNCKAQLP